MFSMIYSLCEVRIGSPRFAVILRAAEPPRHWHVCGLYRFFLDYFAITEPKFDLVLVLMHKCTTFINIINLAASQTPSQSCP
jgi:hypothetical protein